MIYTTSSNISWLHNLPGVIAKTSDLQSKTLISDVQFDSICYIMLEESHDVLDTNFHSMSLYSIVNAELVKHSTTGTPIYISKSLDYHLNNRNQA